MTAPITMRSSTRVNPEDKAGDIPAIKYDIHGKVTVIAVGRGYVMARRPGAYPFVRTIAEWKAMSDHPPVWSADQGWTFHGERS